MEVLFEPYLKDFWQLMSLEARIKEPKAHTADQHIRTPGAFVCFLLNCRQVTLW